ncbi:MAG: hypothetical protein ACYDD1_14760 [Caulobacteraceae bacterium]
MTADTPAPKKDDLEHALGAAAEAGKESDKGSDIAADDVGASKLSLEIDREGKLPTSHPPGESSH